MLVANRKVNERVIIELENGEVIEVVLVDVRKSQARIGIIAPKCVNVNREEVYLRILEERLNNK